MSARISLTCIGLTLVQEILAGHGFDYTLERTAEETTRFTVVMRS